MVARSKLNDQTAEEYKEANGLSLLAKIGAEYGRVFRCKTCLREFSSFQALGGHRASHKKPTTTNNNGQDQSTTKSSSHTCPICGAYFPLGQALGGHMRRHRTEKSKSVGALVTRSFFSEENSFFSEENSPVTTTTLKKSSNEKIEDLDIDTSSINLELKL